MTRTLVAMTTAGALLLACAAEPQLDLEPLAKPGLGRLDASVQAQIETALVAVESQSEGASSEAYGEAWGALGRLYDAYDFSTAAAVCYRNARALAPEEFEWHYYSARLARTAGDLAAAETALESALSVAANEPVALAELGRLRLDQRRPAEAGEIAAALIADEPQSAAGLLLAAQAAVEQRDWARARADYERLLALQPAADRLHRPAAMACREMGDADCARRHLALQGSGPVVLADPWVQTLRELRTGVNSILDEGLTLYQRGEFAAAERLFAEAIAADPENARAHLDRGSALKAMGRLTEALAEFDEALRLQPVYPKAHYNRGVALAAGGDDAAAVVEYERALELDPRYSEARFNRANALWRLGRPEEALPAYIALIEDNPADGAAHLGRALCLVGTGRDREAVTALEESDRVFPRSPTFKNLLSRILATSDDGETRDTGRALDLARDLAAAAQTVEHLETLAMAQAAAGDFEAAEETLGPVVTALQRANRADEAERLSRQLDGYRAGNAPRDPGVG